MGLYNALVSGIPRCYPVAPDEFGAGLTRSHYPLELQQILVACDAGKVRGFINYTVQGADDKQPQPTGIIVFYGMNADTGQ